MKNRILGITGFIGFFLFIGAIGGMEQDRMSDMQFVAQSVLGLVMMFLTGHFAGFMSYQNDMRKNRNTHTILRKNTKNRSYKKAG